MTDPLPITDPQEESRPGRFLPYPVSTLSAAIIPADLSSFRSRGAAGVERHFRSQMAELRSQYVALIDQFNWNKLVYEARFGFEPLTGETYHLYEMGDGFTLSMIEPGRWPGKKWIASLTLTSGGHWEPVAVAENFDLRSLPMMQG
ncbi:MAG: hypothetical protein KGS60_01010 [Verrucomicrobia bacterium]|nr:hypothetical protein [Verrucomicrobiota bacterium]